MAATTAMTTLWVDVEDLFEYAERNPRPSGIQRLAFEMDRVLQAQHKDRVRFVRHHPSGNTLMVVEWAKLEALFSGLVAAHAPGRPAPAKAFATPASPGGGRANRLGSRLPPEVRRGVIDVVIAQKLALRLLRQALGAQAGTLRRLLRLPRIIAASLRGTAGDATEFEAHARPGDVILVLGSPWGHPDYAGLLASVQERFGLRVAILVYDLIPILRPEFCDRNLVRLFRAWFVSVLPRCDLIFAISHATARDVETWAPAAGIALQGPVTPIPIGTGFGTTPMPERTPRLPPEGSYVLIVSTIEARKNHLLAFRIWRRLLEELPPEQVPTLVFAGRIGWMVADLMQQIANTANLDGKLLIVEDPSDGELAALYLGCRFTLFPSFYEGWGLPVTESLAFGKPCLIADRTSLPEAGMGLARSFDPDNLNDAYARVHEVIADPALLAAWEARVRTEFRPTPWSATVDAMLGGIAAHLPAGSHAARPDGTPHRAG